MTLFLKRSKYIRLDIYVLRKTQKAKCGSKPRVALKSMATIYASIGPYIILGCNEKFVLSSFYLVINVMRLSNFVSF